jgi:hypothetical protein
LPLFLFIYNVCPYAGDIFTVKKGVTLHVLILVDNKIFGKYSWLYLVFTHVSLGIFYLLVLSRSVTVPLCGWDRGTFCFTSGPSGRTGRLWAVPTDRHWRRGCRRACRRVSALLLWDLGVRIRGVRVVRNCTFMNSTSGSIVEGGGGLFRRNFGNFLFINKRNPNS